MKSLKKYPLALLVVLISTIAILPGTICAQGESPQLKQRKRELAKTKDQQEAEERQAIEDMKAYQRSIQDKKTLRRMKKDRKKADRYNHNKREFFLVRWWKAIFKKKRY